MDLEIETTSVAAGDAVYPVYSTRSKHAVGPLPGVIVVQEIFGVTEHTHEVARRFADVGYHAFVPDLYAINGTRDPGLTVERLTEFRHYLDSLPLGSFWDPTRRADLLAQRPAEQRERFTSTLAAMYPIPLARMTSTLVAVARWARAGACAGRGVGALGFCTGGELVGLMACEDPDLAAAVVYYGTPPPADKVPAIQAPVLGLFGGTQLDARITKDVPAFEQAMKAANKRFEYVIYETARHAFFNDTRPFWHADAVRDSWARALRFLASELR